MEDLLADAADSLSHGSPVRETSAAPHSHHSFSCYYICTHRSSRLTFNCTVLVNFRHDAGTKSIRVLQNVLGTFRALF